LHHAKDKAEIFGQLQKLRAGDGKDATRDKLQLRL
jgi:hypothetical protein